MSLLDLALVLPSSTSLLSSYELSSSRLFCFYKSCNNETLLKISSHFSDKFTVIKHSTNNVSSIEFVQDLSLFGPFAPIAIVHSCVLKQSSKYKDEAHDQVDVDGFHIADTRQRRAYACTNGGHCEHSRNTYDEIKKKPSNKNPLLKRAQKVIKVKNPILKT